MLDNIDMYNIYRLSQYQREFFIVQMRFSQEIYLKSNQTSYSYLKNKFKNILSIKRI